MNAAFRSILALVAGMCFLLPAIAERATKLEPAGSAPNNERRVALVIGNGAYATAPLRNPVNDARAVAQLLSEVGFSVTLMEDATEAGMIRSIRTFGDELLRGGVGLFYYAGHGMQLRGRNFLVPVGADIRREDEVEYQAVDADRVLSKMESAKNGLNIVILDACRNNPFARSFRSSKNGLAEMNAPTGTLIAFATAPGSIAADGDGDNSLYTKHLLERMRSPGLPIERVMKQVRIDVTRETGDQQVPWESSSLKGDFYFIAPDPRNTAQGRRRAQQEAVERALREADARAAKEREALLKQAAEERVALEQKTKALIEQALAKQAAELEAEQRMRAKARGAVSAAGAPTSSASTQDRPRSSKQRETSQGSGESALWQSIQSSTNHEDFLNYLERYPSGAYASEARRRYVEFMPYGIEEPKLAKARVAEPASTSPTPFPRAGDKWRYRMTPVGSGKAIAELIVKVDGVLGDTVYETTSGGGMTSDWVYGTDLVIVGSSGSGFFDFAPYLNAYQPLKVGDAWTRVTDARIRACVKSDCTVTAKVTGRERVKVPAGTFDALRVEVELVVSKMGVTGGRDWGITGRRGMYWYVPEVKRYVRAIVETTSGSWDAEDVEIQLVAYELH